MPFLAAIPAAVAVGAAGVAGNAIAGGIESGQRSGDQQRQQLAQQQAFIAAQQNAQNAINSQSARDVVIELQKQNAMVDQLGLSTGVNNQQNSYGQLGNISGNLGILGNQYGDIAAGRGPNPAQAMLAQQTGQNVANQAALMAGQRNAGSNAGLIARQAAQQGSAIQQQAINQAAILQAQQSLAAMGQQGNIYGQQAGIAGQQAGIGANQVGQVLQAQGMANNLATNKYNADLSALTGANQIGGQLANTALAGQNASNLEGQKQTAENISGALSGMGSALTSAFAPQKKAEGGEIKGPKSMLGQHFIKIKMAKGGKVPALVSPGEKIISKKDLPAIAAGKKAPMEAGKTVPGKAKVPGAKNSYANDTVPMSLNEGDVVLPRSVTQSKHPAWAAHKFVSEIMAKNGLPTKKVK